ncbi:hypothetical protein [uncultured Enterococcus sp.]|uniref:hypothetical protein n=1 Tax=uncultured Enterococcus sp. TaxID=167972 RepID=UPI002AA63C70|nr:hypothetical protein [uncultured Enterococcus sp.]
MSAPINFEGYRITNLSYQFNPKIESTKKDIDLETTIEPEIKCSLADDLTHGLVTITIDVRNAGDRNLSITVDGHFSIDLDMVSEETEIQELIAMNGSAILMPYVRSLVSMVTSLDSPKSIIIPTINIYDFFNNNNE